MSERLAIFTSPFSLKHDTGDGHPECAARIEALEPILSTYPQISATAAELDDIFLAHDEDYIFDLQDKIPDFGYTYLDNDTIISPDSYDAALYAAGAAINAINYICAPHDSQTRRSTHNSEATAAGLAQQTSRAFVAARPPGHHAETDKAMGFCLFNNIFIAARYAQQHHDIKRIAIIDFDIHHGNGTEEMTRRHNRNHPELPILYISTHGYPLFPMSGDPAENNETTLNARLPDKCSSAVFRDIYEKEIFPQLSQFAPEVILISAGFDAHKDDPLGAANLETEDYGWITQRLCTIAQEHSNGRILSVLEGGYHLDALKECVKVHLRELAR